MAEASSYLILIFWREAGSKGSVGGHFTALSEAIFMYFCAYIRHAAMVVMHLS